MTKEEIQHLARLSRIHLSEKEIESFAQEADAILGYVDQIKELSFGERKPVVPPHQNPLRDDVVTHTPGAYTDAILDAFPKRVGRYALVKKILSNDNA